jgi:glycosyltransferase involved in cell wall biosynthesis
VTRQAGGSRGERSGTRGPAKVLVFIGALDVGGSESDVARNFPRFDRDRFEVTIAEFNHAGPLGADLDAAGVRVISRRTSEEFRAARRGGRLAELRERAAVLRWVVGVLRSEDPDITHSVLPHSYVYQIMGAAIAHSRARTVMSRRSLNFYKNTQWLFSWLERVVLHRRVDIVIGNSQAIVGELIAEGVDAHRVRLIYNGIDLAPYVRSEVARAAARERLGIERDAFVMIAVGNLHTYKGHRDLIEACAEIRASLPAGWRLIIAGRDQEGNRATYDALIESLGLGQNVRLLGLVPDVSGLLLAGDLFVQPSHHEGLPNAVIEAMAASLPVVGTLVGGIPELVVGASDGASTAGTTGWLVEPSDSHALALALATAASDSALRAAMGRRGRARAEALFSIERSVGEYEAIYGELLP